MHTHHFENLEVWKGGCRLARAANPVGTEPLNKTPDMIEETREMSRMPGSLIDRLVTSP
jgi:hypothetical protein